MKGQSLGDSHCHIGVDCTREDVLQLATKIDEIGVKLLFFHIMTTFHQDVDLIDCLLDNLQNKSAVVPYYGVHPWYSHLYTCADYENGNMSENEVKADHYNKVLLPQPTKEFLDILPTPKNIYKQIDQYKLLFTKHNIPYGIGEIGLDKLFRIPANGYFGNKLVASDGLSCYRTTVDHQLAIFQRQLAFATDLKKQVSLHCVKAHGKLYDTMLHYPEIPKIILHSFSGSPDQLKLWVRNFPQVMFSFSYCINGKKIDNLHKFIDCLSKKQILIETDYPLDAYVLGKLDQYWHDLEEIWLIISKRKGIIETEIDENINRSIGLSEDL